MPRDEREAFAPEIMLKQRMAVPRPKKTGSRLGSKATKGEIDMAHAVNAGARLDRLPISSFHYRIFWLVGAGMFFDGYDLYIAGGVLASTVQTKLDRKSTRLNSSHR